MSPALAGGFLTTAPLGKPEITFKMKQEAEVAQVMEEWEGGGKNTSGRRDSST